MWHIEIVSPGVVGNVSASSITLGGPAFAVSIAKLRDTLQGAFNVTHTYLYEPSIPDCVTFQMEVQNILARWYYLRSSVHSSNTTVVIVTPGKTKQKIL